MKTLMLFVGCFLGLMATSCAQEKVQLEFVINNTSQFKIYVSGLHDSLTLPVRDLQNYIFKVSGAELPIVNKVGEGKKLLVVGLASNLQDLVTKPELTDLKPRGFLIKIKKSRIIITGLDYKGVSNGIYTFLEKYLGCRYYAEDAIVTPKEDTILFPRIIDLQNPAFEIGILHSYEAFSPEYCRWHKLEMTPRSNPLWLKPWIHTTLSYVPAKKYFSSHPEYFMWHKGKRRKEDIDFSNKAVFDLLVDKITSKVKEYPYAQYVGVSQADGNRWGICSCGHCQQVVKQGGSASAVVVNLANKVATKFPDKTITTLAYHYTQKPPTSSKFKPESNVMVILCNTKLNRLQATQLKTGNAFFDDLQAWRKMTSNIMVWDYFANMYFPITPFPNLLLLQKNIQTYKDLGISKVFAQSNGQKGAEFQELRSYLLAKLLWNPGISIDSVMTDFLMGYYGKAAPYIKKYIHQSANNFANSRQQLRRNIGPVDFRNGFLSPELLKEYEGLFVQAKDRVKDDSLFLNRVDKEQQALRFAQLEIHKVQTLSKKKRKINKEIIHALNDKEYNDILDKFVSGLEKYKLYKVSYKAKSPEKYKQQILKK